MLATLLAATAGVYSSVRWHAFIGYDTPDYITQNPHVRAGLTIAGLVWAFTTTWAGNWLPLTWLSHMLDVELFGLASGPLHLVNLGLHLLTTAVLYAWLRRMTGARWPALLVAAVFALHPLHVESVAWLAERKDVLSGLFWMLTLWTYTRYVERSTRVRYAEVVTCFVLGLMSKSMIVTLPAVLLLLDFWPLRRMAPDSDAVPPSAATRGRPFWWLVREKLPLAALAIGTGLVTLVAQRGSGAVVTLRTISLASRVGNALLAFGAYLRTAVWPRHLAVFYPFPRAIPAAPVALTLGVLLLISWIAWRTRRTRPYLAVGWCWFLCTLLPVIGLLQVGAQARADRYMYVPLIGVAIAVAWGIGDLARERPRARVALATAAVAACTAFAARSYAQVSYWRDTPTLFRHAIAATDDNDVAYNALGTALARRGQTIAAIAAYEASLRISPGFAEAHGNLAAALLDANRPADALPHLRQAIAIEPALIEPQVNLGSTYDRLGDLDAAAAQFRAVLSRWPGNLDARSGLAIVLSEQGRIAEAVPLLAEVIRRAPANAVAHERYGQVLSALGRAGAARQEFETAIRLKANSADAHYDLATLLTAQAQYDAAIGEYERALAIDPSSAKCENNLGGALASVGRYAEAVVHFKRAVALAPGFPGARANLARAEQLAQGGGLVAP